MLAFEIRDGVAVPCEYVGIHRQAYATRAPVLAFDEPSAKVVSVDLIQQRAHIFDTRTRQAALYLPAGEEPARGHYEAVWRTADPVECTWLASDPGARYMQLECVLCQRTEEIAISQFAILTGGAEWLDGAIATHVQRFRSHGCRAALTPPAATVP